MHGCCSVGYFGIASVSFVIRRRIGLWPRETPTYSLRIAKDR